MRIILYTGKGGVGKTSIACATALLLASSGKKVLIMSTDQAHSLSDSFEIKLSGDIRTIYPGLDALEIDAVKESEEAWGKLQDYLKLLLTSKAEGGIEAEELLVFPGLEELFSLSKILDIYESAPYDVLIVDCAPTGETVSLLKFPQMFSGFLEKVLPMKRKAAAIAGPAVQKITKIPMPGDAVFNDIERLTSKLTRLQALMQQKDVLSLRIVTTPEKIVVQEAKRNFTYLHLYGYNVDAVIINKIYPKEALEGYFYKWIHLQQEGLQELEHAFSNIPIFHLPLLKTELKSITLLKEIGEHLYGTYNPADVFVQNKIFEISSQDSYKIIHLYLPFMQKDELDLVQHGQELDITVKNEQQTLLLPDELISMEIEKAKYENGALQIYFHHP